ncbi:MAG: hypothetical protein ABIO76_01095 [Ginsengibacter sp.]
MQSHSETGQDNSVKFELMILDTKELKNLLEDQDFDGITLQVSQAIDNNTPQDKHQFKLIGYKHFASKKKQEQITDPKFFANNNGTKIYKDLEIGGDGVIGHFGNMKLTRKEMTEDIDTNEYPFLVVSPEHGTGDHKDYIVCNAYYTKDFNAPPPQTQALSRGLSSTKSISVKPSPPA